MMVRRMVQLVAVCMIGSLSVVAEAQAQNAQTRDGFWISGGLGYGTLGCEACGTREGGLSVDLSLGGTISPRFLIGAGTSGWTKSEGGSTLTMGVVDARVRFYPSTRGGLFLTGGVGVGSVQETFDGLGTETETGVGVILGLGYDIRVSPNMSITPSWTGYGMRNDVTDANVGQLGIAITLH
ncbi:MAG TPA: outer membrane beta-barrel protein [Gemmatimonadaceae bacterium]|nr:outer membrane beta-barrel protein [Gemmatimonadaceae bacterium]